MKYDPKLGAFTVTTPGTYTVSVGTQYVSKLDMLSTVADLGGSVESCIKQLERVAEINPELSKAIDFMASKLYKAVK